jgi:hypothetical protein
MCPSNVGDFIAITQGIDDQPQILVAKSLKMRAAKMDPAFILNVGDNFYWGGIEKTCGTPMNELSHTAHHQFNQIFEGVYNGKGLDGKAHQFGRHHNSAGFGFRFWILVETAIMI